MKKTPIIRVDGSKSTDEYEAQAYLTLSNIGGVTIQISDDGDGVRYQWYDNKPSRWQEIKHTSSGRAFFRINKTKYYLDEFMRLNLWK